MKTISISLTDSQHAALSKVAKAMCTPFPDMMLTLANLYLRQWRDDPSELLAGWQEEVKRYAKEGDVAEDYVDPTCLKALAKEGAKRTTYRQYWAKREAQGKKLAKAA